MFVKEKITGTNDFAWEADDFWKMPSSRYRYEDFMSQYRGIQNCYPRKIIFPELIRRGVIYYAGNFLPQIIFVELIMRGNSVALYVDPLFWG